MRKFPHQFSDLLTPVGLSILKGEDKNFRALFHDPKNYFATFEGAIDRSKAESCAEILDRHLYEHLSVVQEKIPPESITKMRRNYSEKLTKTMRIKTAYFQRRSGRAFQAAERVGLLPMMRPKISALPPGGNGMIHRTGFAG